MLSNHPASSKSFRRLFHISEEPGIRIFEPRPSPSFFAEVKAGVVFAIEERLLHNYLLPRDCPRVTYCRSDNTTPEDEAKFFGESTADFVVIVESGWCQRIQETKLYRYELPTDHFTLLDECAGYYISYVSVAPLAVEIVEDIVTELLTRNIELRFTPSLVRIAEAVDQSSMNYSVIRMRNARR